MALSNSELMQHLIQLAASLDIRIREDSIEGSRGGLYILKGSKHVVVDRDLDPNEKIDIIVDAVKKQDLSNVYVLPALRDLLET